MPIDVAKYRSVDMKVVSGAMGREKVHYEAPAPERVQKEMTAFLDWFNSPDALFQCIKLRLWGGLRDTFRRQEAERDMLAAMMGISGMV